MIQHMCDRCMQPIGKPTPFRSDCIQNRQEYGIGIPNMDNTYLAIVTDHELCKDCSAELTKLLEQGVGQIKNFMASCVGHKNARLNTLTKG